MLHSAVLRSSIFNNGEKTPLSGYPSKFMNDAFLSPGNFYLDWNFGTTPITTNFGISLPSLSATGNAPTSFKNPTIQNTGVSNSSNKTDSNKSPTSNLAKGETGKEKKTEEDEKNKDKDSSENDSSAENK